MRQIKPPGNIPKELDSVFRNVYDEIQRLAQSINTPSGNETSDKTGGKSGDIRLINDKTGGGYTIEGRFDDGWVRFNLGAGQVVKQGQKPLLITGGGPSNEFRTIQNMFPPIAVLRSDVLSGIVTTLPIVPIGVDNILSENDVITVVSVNGFVATFTVSQDVLENDTVIVVTPANIANRLASGSGVYLTQKSLSTWISELEYSISIGSQVTPADVIARVNAGGAYLTKGTTITPSGGLVVSVNGSNFNVTRTIGSFTSDGVTSGDEVEIDSVICTVVSTTSTVMTVTGALTTGSYPLYILGRNTIPVTSVPIALRSDLNWKIIVTDLENNQEYLCQVSSSTLAGATSIPIKRKILGVQDKSPIRLDQLSLISYINISADAIDLRSLFLAGAIYLGDLNQAYTGTTSSLAVKSPFLRIPIRTGDSIFIVDKNDPELVSSHTVSASANALATSIAINSSTVNKPIDSKIFLNDNSSSAFLRITGDSVTTAVQRINLNNSLCRLSSAVSGSVSSLPISDLTTDLYTGDQLFIYDAVTLQPTAIQLASNAVSGATSLSIVPQSITAPSQSGIHLRSSFARTQIKQTADAITTSVERFSVAGSLGVTNAAISFQSGTFFISLASPGLPYAINAGERFYIVDKNTGTSYRIEVLANQNAGVTSFQVNSVGGVSISAVSGSGVHTDTSLTRSVVNQTASSISSVVQATSTANAFALLQSNLTGSVSSLPLNTGIPFPLVSGQKLYVININTAVSYPVEVSANVAQGANAIPIVTASVIAPSGSGVNLNVGDYGTKLLQTVDQVAITANKVYGSFFISTLGVGYNGNRTSIQLNGLLYPVKSGDKIYIVDQQDQKYVNEVTASEDKAATTSLVTLNISSAFVKAGTSSSVYLGGVASTGSVKVLSDQINLAVTDTKFRDYLNGQFISEVQSVSSPTVTVTLKRSTTYPIFAGDKIRFSHNPSTVPPQTLADKPPVIKEVTKVSSPQDAYAIGTTSITFNNTTGVSADMIMNMEVAGPYSTGSSLQIFANNITVDTPILRSSGYSAGVSGWAIKGNGSAEFNDVIVRGSITANSGAISGTLTLGTDGKISNNQSDGFVIEKNGIRFFENSGGSGITSKLKYNSLVFGDAAGDFNSISSNDFTMLKTADRSTLVSFNLTGNILNAPITSQNQNVPRVFSGSGAPSGTLTNSVVRDFYHRTDTNQLYLKTASTTWTLMGP